MTLLQWSYQCNLRAFILLPEMSRPIDTDQDVVDLASHAYFPVTDYMFPTFTANRTM